jgi:hypothetical protein
MRIITLVHGSCAASVKRQQDVAEKMICLLAILAHYAKNVIWQKRRLSYEFTRI